MYRRDLGIILLSIFAIFWSLQNEGTYQYYKSFYYDVPQEGRLVEEQHTVPQPIVVRAQCSTVSVYISLCAAAAPCISTARLELKELSCPVICGLVHVQHHT